ncbi:hypothetical protein [Nostoc sp.]
MIPIFWVNMRSHLNSKPRFITQTQFRRKFLTNQYSLRSPSSVETTKNYNELHKATNTGKVRRI